MKYLLASVFCFPGMAVNAQSAHSSYLLGYERSFISGIPKGNHHAPPDTSETKKDDRQQKEYYIYGAGMTASFKKSEYIWIRQQCYRVMVKPVTQLPVIVSNPMHTDTLISNTNHILYQVVIHGIADKQVQLQAGERELAAKNDVFIRFKNAKGAWVTYILPKLKKLAPLVGQ